MADQYALAAARVSVAQLADDVGFDSMHTSSYAILSELLMRYMEEVGLASHGYAELASRTEPNALDVMLALNDLGVSIAELKEFKATQKGVAFAAPIVPFPVAKRPKSAPTFESLGETPPPHVPAFLPAFPDKHTYCGTSALPLPSQDATARHLAGVEAAAEGEPPPGDEYMSEPMPGEAGSSDPVAGEAAATGAAGVFQPWDWQARLTGLTALPREAGIAAGAEDEDAFAAAAGAGTAVSTKHGRQAKRSARALDAGYAPADPTRARVENIIAVAGSAEESVAAGGGGPGSELLYGADDDDAEQL